MQRWLNKILVTFFQIVFFTSILMAGNPPLLDINLIKKVKLKQNSMHTGNRPYIYKGEKNVLKKYNPVNMAFGGLLYVYQNTLSQQFSASCLYNPSCSEFSKLSISEYGLLKGAFLSADRLSRCNRIAATGIHPIRVENNKVLDPISFYKSGK